MLHTPLPRAGTPPRGFLPWPGSKARLLVPIFGLVAEAIPATEWGALTFADPFLGSARVAHAAKQHGFGTVLANDLALRSVIVGEALVANSSQRLGRGSVLRLFQDAPPVAADRPEVLNRVGPLLGGWLTNVWRHLYADSFDGVERDLIRVIVLRTLLQGFPMSLPSASDAAHFAAGDFDRLSPPRACSTTPRPRRGSLGRAPCCARPTSSIS